MSLKHKKGVEYQRLEVLELLNPDLLQQALPDKIRKALSLHLLNEVDSTNQYLLSHLELPSGTVVFAEYQMRGRGQRQRKWYAPFGTNINCSILWKFRLDAGELSGLSLAVGIAVISAIERYCLETNTNGFNDLLTCLGLKWPNDILWNYKKLGGILIELTAEPHSQTNAVIGIGLNVNISKQASKLKIEQDWIDICTVTRATAARNHLAVCLIEELFEMLWIFQERGFSAFTKHWQALDAYYDKPVRVFTPQKEIHGIAKGVTNKGELIVIDQDQQEIRFLQGEVSLRLDLP